MLLVEQEEIDRLILFTLESSISVLNKPRPRKGPVRVISYRCSVTTGVWWSQIVSTLQSHATEAKL
jgi:hypothetical protein